MPMEEGPHRNAMLEAVALDGEAHRLLLAGDAEAARATLRRAAARYRDSWELAPPRSFGRLIGMVKASVLAGDAAGAARYVREQVPEADSPPSSYALAVAALALGDDDEAVRLADGMREGSPAFGRTADALAALGRGDREAYMAALGAIVSDFEQRDEHLTGVPIADTALLLEALAEPRGLAARPSSGLLPA
jgi:hypothetical protein